jgi:hypothetical protein
MIVAGYCLIMVALWATGSVLNDREMRRAIRKARRVVRAPGNFTGRWHS